MNSLYIDRQTDDETRRRDLYDGQLYVYTPSEATQALCAIAREMCEEAFHPFVPTEAQHHMGPKRFHEILTTLKPSFIHDPRCKDAIRQLLTEKGCDLNRTFFDVPRLRTATANGYLSSGLAYAFKPHRDTWYSTPRCQINWWLPVYDIEANNCMSFHTYYWGTPLSNSSSEFNYQDWNSNGRKAAHNQGKVDTRRQSEALEPVQLEPEMRIITEVNGLIIFSAAHLHSTVPNTSDVTRISIDFRTVHLDELSTNAGAPNEDSACSGTTIGDYLCAADYGHLPEDVQKAYTELASSQEPVSLELA